jgi:hypothetical protein
MPSPQLSRRFAAHGMDASALEHCTNTTSFYAVELVITGMPGMPEAIEWVTHTHDSLGTGNEAVPANLHIILLQLVFEFISSCLPSIKQQYRDLECKPLKTSHCNTCFGLLGHHQMHYNSGELCAFRATAIGVFVFTTFLNGFNVVPSLMPHLLSL